MSRNTVSWMLKMATNSKNKKGETWSKARVEKYREHWQGRMICWWMLETERFEEKKILFLKLPNEPFWEWCCPDVKCFLIVKLAEKAVWKKPKGTLCEQGTHN